MFLKNKKKSITKICLLMSCFQIFYNNLFGYIQYPDFDRSMLRLDLGLQEIYPDFEEKNREQYAEKNPVIVSFFRNLYYENIRNSAARRPTLRIPKIIHQIWLGSPVPEKFKIWMNTWANLEGWEYKLWTDENVHKIPLYNQELYDHAENFGEKSDILRLELLNMFGGVYVDTDLECLDPKAFEELHHSFDFYICFEPLEHGFIYKFNMFKFCNAIIGSAPNHSLVDCLIVNLKANYLAYQNCCGAVQRTGPSYLTRMICAYELLGNHKQRNMYMPCTFFYPLSEPEMRYFSEHKLCIPFLEETAGFHYWAQSWLNREFQPFTSTYCELDLDK